MTTGHPAPQAVKDEAFRLRCEGLTQREIGLRLGVPKGTIGNWLRRMRGGRVVPVSELWVGDLKRLVENAEAPSLPVERFNVTPNGREVLSSEERRRARGPFRATRGGVSG